MRKLRTFLLLLALAVAFAGGYGSALWSRLQSAHARIDEKRILYYVDPMHPTYKSDKPGVAPDCGMRLEPVYEEPTKPAPHSETAAEAPMGTIRISPEKQQLIGVRYGEVEETAGERTIRALGKVALDETRIVRVHARVDGWIDQVFADFTGKEVTEGQKLLTLYSPEMFATQQEFLLALKSRDILQSGALHTALEHSDSLIEATRRRLELWDLSESQIDEIARTKQPIRSITLYSPAGGYVLSRNSFPKQRITPEMELYAIVDLNNVWVIADVFGQDAGSVRPGMAAIVTLPYSGRKLSARVSYIQPLVDPATRTLKIRLDIPNPGLALKPEMFVDVDLRMALPKRVTVPAEAVLDTGLRQTVFVDRGNGSLEPRQIEIGDRGGGPHRDPKGIEPGRANRHLGRLPHRFREPDTVGGSGHGGASARRSFAGYPARCGTQST